MTVFAFLDCETTGLKPTKCHVLEVAWVLTDSKFDPISTPKTFLVELGLDWDDAIAQVEASAFLTKMHTDSDLWADLHLSDNLVPMADIKQAFIDDVDLAAENGFSGPVRLAGYSISFDREFLRNNGWADEFSDEGSGFRFHHRILDLSSNIQMFEAAGREIPFVENDNPHRALDDALNAQRLAVKMRDELSVPGVSPDYELEVEQAEDGTWVVRAVKRRGTGYWSLAENYVRVNDTVGKWIYDFRQSDTWVIYEGAVEPTFVHAQMRGLPYLRYVKA